MGDVTWDVGVRHALKEARTVTDGLFTLVCSNSFYERPIAMRHRIVFYLGHIEAFDWNLIGRRVLELPGFNPRFDELFAFGIDPDPLRGPQDEPSDWPRAEDVLAYGLQVRNRLDQVLDSVDDLYLNVALEHRLMHAETFAYMLHNLPYDRRLPFQESAWDDGKVEPRFVEVPAGSASMGRDRGSEFGWDNEFVRHVVDVPAFAIGKYKVTNGEYLKFVDDGGPVPHFWNWTNGNWKYRGIVQEIPLPLSWPVYVSYEQAQAYADWTGKRLPSEAEFQHAAYSGKRDLNPERDNFDFRRWDPQPVTMAGENEFGIAGLVGNGWELTSTEFGPFEGFEAFPFYPGYSADFFDGEHYVLKGASPRTAYQLTRPSFRNWFRKEYPYAYTTFRLVEK